MKDPQTLWFNSPDPWSLCRAGGNGPAHPSQLYAIKKYVQPGMSLLDVGCGSAATWEAIRTAELSIRYKGVDMIPKNVEWCQNTFPEAFFQVQDGEALNEEDKSFDVVYSRHVVDHMPSFEKALDEHCRVAKKLVIVILWVPLSDSDEHQIKNIIDQGKTYEQEYTNSFSRKLVKEYLENKKGWKLLELTENIKNEDGTSAKHDTAIVLQRDE